MAEKLVKVKKVKAYPIAIQIKGGPGNEAFATSGQIQKLTPAGFLCEVPPLSHQPGDKFVAIFELPVLHIPVSENIVMVKLYNQWGGSSAGSTGATSTAAVPGVQQAPAGAPPAPTPGTVVVHLAEYHFVNLSLAGKESIFKFLKAMSKA